MVDHDKIVRAVTDILEAVGEVVPECNCPLS